MPCLLLFYSNEGEKLSESLFEFVTQSTLARIARNSSAGFLEKYLLGAVTPLLAHSYPDSIDKSYLPANPRTYGSKKVKCQLHHQEAGSYDNGKLCGIDWKRNDAHRNFADTP